MLGVSTLGVKLSIRIRTAFFFTQTNVSGSLRQTELTFSGAREPILYYALYYGHWLDSRWNQFRKQIHSTRSFLVRAQRITCVVWHIIILLSYFITLRYCYFVNSNMLPYIIVIIFPSNVGKINYNGNFCLNHLVYGRNCY